MVEKTQKEHDDRGLSARHLILLFLVGVAVCGVFFSLGFLVGYNERGARVTPATERVANPAPTPPVVNPPSESPPVATTPAETSVKPPAVTGESKSAAEGAASSSASSPAPPPKGERREAASSPESSSTASGEVGVGFTVQVAASRAKEDAESLVKILKARDYPVFMVAPEYAHAGDNLFRVQVGPFKSRDDAEKVRKQLLAEGFKPFIKH